ncbi:MAG: YkgJ family cysteine cluster protein [Geobacteraceae bacterium]|nr:YkgJ family cysteine cluster protein [Geobacteraceae bacterium]
MHSTPSDGSLANYRLLLDRIDNLCDRITEEFASEISCKAGCSGCCRHLTLFAVEAANLISAVKDLPGDIRQLLAGRMDWAENSACPFLIEDRCVIYSARPVICRTHGLPLLFEANGTKNIDCCPENFKASLPLTGSAVINIETVNTLLFTINTMFVAKTDDERLKKLERFTIAEIIRFSEEIV